jgi:hypothetical protein
MKMSALNLNLLNSLLFSKKNRFILGILFSLLSLTMVFLHLFNLLYLGIISYFIGLFVVLFLPSYPLFFVLMQKLKITNLEKYVFSIISNISYYVIIGYFGNLIGFYLNGFFFFFSVLLVYLTLIIICFLRGNVKHCNSKKLVSIENNKVLFKNNVIKDYFKRIINRKINSILLSLFLLLLCIFFLTLFPYFNNTDAWLHISIIKNIDINGYLLPQDYYDAMGIHIYSIVYHYFSNMEIISIPRYFTFYGIMLSAILFYTILKKIFNNKNFAIFGVFLLEFSSLGLITMVSTFYPTPLALFQSTLILSILYTRGKKFVEEKEISLKKVQSGMSSSYLLITFLFIGSLLTHSLITTIMLISYLWIFLIYFIKDFRRGIDLTILCLLCVILLFFLRFGRATGHLSLIINIFTSSNIQFYIIFLGLGGLSLLLIPIVRKFVKGIKFGRKNIIILFKEKEILKKRYIEYKYVIPMCILLIILISAVLLIASDIFLNLNVQTIFTIAEIFFIGIFATWGYIWFQKSSRGEILFIWFIGLILILTFGFLYDIFIAVINIWPRILYLSSFSIAIGFVSYIHKLIKLNIIKRKSTNIFLLSVIIISLIISISEISYFTKLFSLEKKEVKSIQFFSDKVSEKKVVISEFGETYAIIYFNYQYNSAPKDFYSLDLHHFLFINETYLKPYNHFNENNKNVLKILKNRYQTELYFFLTRYQFQFGNWKMYSSLSDQEAIQYYNLSYLNRICSSRDLNGNEKPVYWVI